MAFPTRLVLLILAVTTGGTSPHAVQDDVLRHVSISATEANLRTGPGLQYPIDWVYKRQGLPLAVIGERDTWRRVRDIDGITGWMHVSLLTGRRTAAITGTRRALYTSPAPGSAVILYADAGVTGKIERCRDLWCELDIAGRSGWIEQRHLWGVKPNETVN